MVDRLVVRLDSWIIQDGNYGDFSRADDVSFALEFFTGSPLEAFDSPSAPTPSLTHVGDASYDIIGQVAYVAEDWWVIDLGVLAFQDATPPANARQGGWLYGKAGIGIDPFFYFERFGHLPGVPALIYDWKIDKIDIQTAPFIEVAPKRFERDPSKLGWKEIASTDAWEEVYGEYLLHCTHIGGPRLPRSRRQP